jgi:hypothetical protein
MDYDIVSRAFNGSVGMLIMCVCIAVVNVFLILKIKLVDVCTHFLIVHNHHIYIDYFVPHYKPYVNAASLYEYAHF